jgi:hypothetical protein
MSTAIHCAAPPSLDRSPTRPRPICSGLLGSARAALRPERDPANGGDEDFDILRRVVKRERGPDRTLQPKAAQNRLSAMVAGAHGDALAVQGFTDVLSTAAVEDERHNAGTLARRADEAQPGNGAEASDGLLD